MPTDPLKQLRDNDMELGDLALSNIGKMLREEGWPGPDGNCPPCPMFKDMQKKYREIRTAELFVFDEAMNDLEIFRAIGFSESKYVACCCFYFENSTALNIKNSLELYEKITKDKKLSEVAFKKMIDQCCVQLGTLIRMDHMGVFKLDHKHRINHKRKKAS